MGDKDGRRWIAADPALTPGLVERLETRFPYYDVNFKHWLPVSSQARILDFGCGAGGFLKYLERLGYRDVTGFDVDVRYASFCRTHARARVEHAEDGLAFLDSAAGTYDFVFAREVVYYFPRSEVSRWFGALADTLRPGGRLVIEVFNGATTSGLWPYVNDPYIQNVFSEHSLRYLLENAGLRILGLTGERYPRHGLAQAIWLTGRRVLATARRVVFLLERGRDDQNPTIFGKSIIAVAERP